MKRIEKGQPRIEVRDGQSFRVYDLPTAGPEVMAVSMREGKTLSRNLGMDLAFAQGQKIRGKNSGTAMVPTNDSNRR